MPKASPLKISTEIFLTAVEILLFVSNECLNYTIGKSKAFKKKQTGRCEINFRKKMSIDLLKTLKKFIFIFEFKQNHLYIINMYNFI